MLLFASVVLTLSLQFDAEHIPDAEIELVQAADEGLWYSPNQGFTADEPFGLALTPSAGRELHFALREYNANCIHNGVITLPVPLSDLTETAVTDIDANYRISQNTCAYASLTTTDTAKGNKPSVRISVSAESSTASTPTTVKTAVALQQAPWRPSPPQAEPTVYGWSRTNAQGEITEHYSSNPQVAVPVYSLSKTFIATMAALLYRKQFDHDLLAKPLSTWGKICEQNSWRDVTMADALNMRTGHYQNLTHGSDEAAKEMIENFFDAPTHSEKREHACGYPQQEKKAIVYQTSTTYLAATALAKALTKQNHDLDTYLYQSLWQPLQLSPLAHSIDKTKDQAQQVWGGYGLTLLPSDLVKLAHFVQNDPQQLGFKAILDAPGEAYPVPNQPNLRYHQSIWFWQHPETQKWYPFLSGYGGIIVLFLDHNTIYYMVSDQHDHRFKSVIDSYTEHRNKLAP